MKFLKKILINILIERSEFGEDLVLILHVPAAKNYLTHLIPAE